MSHIALNALGGGLQPRLEINTLIQDNYQFSLYVQALNKMYAVDQAQTPSYFQVGGIHGVPYTAYDGGVGTNGFVADAANQWAGYCPHGSTLFPSWHRPYVMLIEQILNHHAQEIAETYTVDKGKWKKAAANLRQPYWDWATKSVPPPEVLRLDHLEITGPNGARKNVTNPLRRYTFHPIDSSFYGPFKQWKTTLRQPDSTTSNAKEDVKKLEQILRNAQSSLTKATYDMFNRVTTWAHFSSHTVGDGGSTSNSVEAIHDNIHGYVGGNGHMGDPGYAGFDPIFYLHHSNVDRLISLWQAIRYDTWTEAGDAQEGTYSLKEEEHVDATTELTPFWKNQKAFYNSNDVRDFQSLGYTYPEFVGLDMSNKDAVKKTISKKVAQLYGPKKSAGNARRDASQLWTGKFSDWAARIKFNRRELGGSFTVCLFMGDAPQDPKQWLTSQNLVGARHAFVHSGNQCTDCTTQNEEGFIPINPWIAEFTGLPSFAAELVAPLLTQKLQWGVLKADGTSGELKSLEVAIMEVPSEMTADAPNPISWAPKLHPQITHGKPGGLGLL